MDSPLRNTKPMIVTSKIKEQRKATCKLCKRGIFGPQEYRWTGTGYAHKECEDKEAAV